MTIDSHLLETAPLEKSSSVMRLIMDVSGQGVHTYHTLMIYYHHLDHCSSPLDYTYTAVGPTILILWCRAICIHTSLGGAC